MLSAYLSHTLHWLSQQSLPKGYYKSHFRDGNAEAKGSSNTHKVRKQVGCDLNPN